MALLKLSVLCACVLQKEHSSWFWVADLGRLVVVNLITEELEILIL